MNRPPLREVALRARVSEPTVSRVLNGRLGVSDRTRDQVVAALEDLGFTDVPAPARTRPGVVGVVCGNFDNPIFPALLSAVSAAFGRHGKLVTVAVADAELNPEERCIDEFRRTGVDAVVFVGGRHAQVDGSYERYHELTEAGVPIVLVNGAATELAVPHVRCDEEAAAHRATAHLLGLGHHVVGCIVGSGAYVPTQRIIAGHRRACADVDAPVDPDAIAETSFTFEGARAAALRLIERGITAIFAANDLMALGAIEAGRSRGRGTPDLLSVVGYDGTDFSAFTDPPLTTLRQPIEDMADLVAAAVQAELAGSTLYRDHYVFEADLLSRASTGPAS